MRVLMEYFCLVIKFKNWYIVPISYWYDFVSINLLFCFYYWQRNVKMLFTFKSFNFLFAGKGGIHKRRHQIFGIFDPPSPLCHQTSIFERPPLKKPSNWENSSHISSKGDIRKQKIKDVYFCLTPPSPHVYKRLILPETPSPPD